MTTLVLHRRPVLGRVLWTLALLLMIGLALTLGLSAALDEWSAGSVRLVIDGQEVVSGFDPSTLTAGEKLIVAGVVMAVVCTLLLVLPLMLLLVLGVVAFAVLLGLGLPLLAVAAVLLVVASPLLLVIVALAWLLRRPARRAPPAAPLLR